MGQGQKLMLHEEPELARNMRGNGRSLLPTLGDSLRVLGYFPLDSHYFLFPLHL